MVDCIVYAEISGRKECAVQCFYVNPRHSGYATGNVDWKLTCVRRVMMRPKKT